MAMLEALLHFHSDPFTFLPYVFKMHRKSILFVSSNLKTTQLHVHPVKMPQSCHSDVRDSIVSILAFCSRGIYIGGGNHQA